MLRPSLVLICLVVALSGCASKIELTSPCACVETAINPVG